MSIRKVNENDFENWRKLRKKVWPTCCDDEHDREMREIC